MVAIHGVIRALWRVAVSRRVGVGAGIVADIGAFGAAGSPVGVSLASQALVR